MKKQFRPSLIACALLLFTAQQIFSQNVTPQFVGMIFDGGSFPNGRIINFDVSNGAVTTLHSFNGSDGRTISSPVIQASDALLYGVTSGGGPHDAGTIFKIKADGSGFTSLHSFNNADGRYISGTLIQASDGALYGMTYTGGFFNSGVIFKIDLNGLGYKILHHFNGEDGGQPYGSLMQGLDGTLYGIALTGSNPIFKINTDGSAFTILYRLPYDYFGSGTLVQGPNGTLYGIAVWGSMYKLNSDGSNITGLPVLDVNEGSHAQRIFILADGSLLVVMDQGGSYGYGTLLKLNADGSNPIVLYQFNGSDGSHPAGIRLLDNILYGVTSQGGTNNGGVIFKYDLTTNVYSRMADLNGASLGSVSLAIPAATIDTPSEAASSITFSKVFSTSMKVSFVAGNGSKHLAVMKAGSAPAFHPVDNTSYSGNLGNGETVVYNSTESSFNLTGLQPGTEYFITVFDYNQDSTATRYQTGNADVASRYTQNTVEQFFRPTVSGGGSHSGTILKFNANDSTAITVLHNFKNITGQSPYGALIQGADEVLYGMSQTGFGTLKYGSIFKMAIDGSDYQILHSFTPTEGTYPAGSLLQTADGSLYGVTQYGGSSSVGTIFKINNDGSGFSVLHHFTNYPDGRLPHGSLIQATDGFLYGVAGGGGANDLGMIYRINPDGSGYAIVHNFSTQNEMNHLGSLIQASDGLLYGMTMGAGSANPGSIYKLSLDGSNYTTLRNFTTIKEGAPWGSLIQAPDGILYGMTMGDATNTSPNGYGTIFKIDTDGNAYSVIHYFNGLDGALPKGDLTFHNNKLFGFTTLGGQYSGGVIFNYDLTTSSYHKIADLNEATGRNAWYGNLLFANAPAGEVNYVVKPGDNSTGVSLNINVTAVEVSQAETYTIELNTDPSFGEGTAIVKMGERTISFANLAMNTTFYSRVKTNVTPSWGPTRKFTTGDALTLAYVISPSNNAKNVSWAPIVKVNPIPGVSTYTVQLSNDHIVATMTSNTTVFQFTGLQQNTTYYASVLTDLNPNTWGSARVFTTGNVTSLSYVTNPRNNAVGISPARNITANTIPSASQYIIQLSEHADFSVIDFELTGSTSTLAFSGLKYNTTYYNRVRTDTTTEFGEVRSFTTCTAASLAYVSSPTNNSVNIKVTKLPVTSHVVPGASTYTIQLSELPDFSSIAFETTGATRSLIFTGLKYNTTYYNRVLTNLTSEYGQVKSFTTPAAPMALRQATNALPENELETLDVNVYPNPFREKLTLYVSSSIYSETKITLTDLNGHKVHESFEKTNSRIEISETLAAGVYIVSANAGEFNKLVKVIKAQ